jgi:hypothetical protein
MSIKRAKELRGLARFECFPMPRSNVWRPDVRPDKPDDRCQDRDLHGEMKAMKNLLEARIGMPAFPKLHARPGQAEYQINEPNDV